MLLRRSHRRRPESSAPLVLPRLDRLSELVDRVVVLLDQAAAPVPGPAPETVVEPESEPMPVGVAGHVLFVADAGGYRLVERDADAPVQGEVVEVDGVRRPVLRVGPSPLPGDGRRCAFLGEEPPMEARSIDA